MSRIKAKVEELASTATQAALTTLVETRELTFETLEPIFKRAISDGMVYAYTDIRKEIERLGEKYLEQIQEGKTIE